MKFQGDTALITSCIQFAKISNNSYSPMKCRCKDHVRQLSSTVLPRCLPWITSCVPPAPSTRRFWTTAELCHQGRAALKDPCYLLSLFTHSLFMVHRLHSWCSLAKLYRNTWWTSPVERAGRETDDRKCCTATIIKTGWHLSSSLSGIIPASRDLSTNPHFRFYFCWYLG